MIVNSVLKPILININLNKFMPINCSLVLQNHHSYVKNEDCVLFPSFMFKISALFFNNILPLITNLHVLAWANCQHVNTIRDSLS